MAETVMNWKTAPCAGGEVVGSNSIMLMWMLSNFASWESDTHSRDTLNWLWSWRVLTLTPSNNTTQYLKKTRDGKLMSRFIFVKQANIGYSWRCDHAYALKRRWMNILSLIFSLLASFFSYNLIYCPSLKIVVKTENWFLHRIYEIH